MPQKRKAKVPAKRTVAKKAAVRRKSSKSIVSKPRFSQKSFMIFGLAFAVIGAIFLFKIFAATARVDYFGTLNASKPTVTYQVTTGTGNMDVSFSNNTADLTLTIKNKAGTTVGSLKSKGKTDVKLSVPVTADTYSFTLATTGKFYGKKGYSIHIFYPTKDTTGGGGGGSSTGVVTLINTPLNSPTVKGTVDFAATVQSTPAISKVEFFVDGALLATDTTFGYSVKWDTTKVVNGPHTLSVKSTNVAGSTGVASGVVEVANNDIVLPPPPPTSGSGFDNNLLQPPADKLLIGVEANGGGYATAKAAAGKNLHVYHTYTTAGSQVKGRLAETPAGTIPLINFKPGGTMGAGEYKTIIAGGRDASIKEAAAAAKAYGKKFFFSPLHEPENDDKNAPYVGDADYAKAFKHIIDVMKANGATNIVTVWNMMGADKWMSRYNTLYPGDSVVDWIASDPYSQGVNKDTLNNFHSVKNFYAWSAKHPKPMMWSEWGMDSANVGNAANFFSKAGIDGIQRDMPRLKALIYWSEWEYDLVNFQSQWKSFANQDEFNWTVPANIAK